MASLLGRRFGVNDYRRVKAVLHAIASAPPTKAMHRIIDGDIAFAHLQSADEVWMVGGYLVHYAVGTPWYSDQLILSELLVVRVGEGGTLRGVTRFLRAKARAAGASLVAVGTALSTNDAALSRLYQAAGAIPEAITLTLEP